MEVRAKKALGQHFLVDQGIAQRIVAALEPSDCADVLEVGPGMGVLTQYLIKREDLSLKMIELDDESVNYLLTHFNGMQGRLFLGDYLKMNIHHFFEGPYRIIGNFPYNISSQIFFKILDDRDRVPEVVCMIQKEVAERIAEGPGSKTYGILSVLLQAWYNIEYLFTVEPGAFAPPPKVRSAVIRLRRNGRTALTVGCGERAACSTLLRNPFRENREGAERNGACSNSSGDTEETEGNAPQSAFPAAVQIPEKLFKTVVKTAFNQRRKTLRNALKPILNPEAEGFAEFIADPVFDLRAERLGVEDFIALTEKCSRFVKV